MSTYAPRETFDRHLKELMDQVLVLGSMVEQAVNDSVQALVRRDQEASRKIYAADERINAERYQIEHNCLTLIATQQPMARDLRILAAILEIITELERMGDYAKGISRINLLLGDDAIEVPKADLERMAEIGLDMLQRALTAFIKKDAESAYQITSADDEVDALYNRIYHEMINQVIQDPPKVDDANFIIWAAHNLERLSDRVTNICERIIFVATGSMKELDRSDDESIHRL
jgi:phosphate transport system protein